MAGTSRYDLVVNGTATPLSVQGGKYSFFVSLGAATSVQLQQKLDSGFVNIGASITASGATVLEVAPGIIQAVVTGTATTTNVSAITVPTITTR